MKNMRRKRKEITYLELNKIMMQESGTENTIFSEVQTGPQEEPILQEDTLDIEQFHRYKEKEKKERKK